MDRIFVKPAAGRTVRSPQHNNRPLPEEGAWVQPDPYWTRRLDDGDVTDDSEAQAKRDAEAVKAAAKGAKLEQKEV